MKLKKAGNSRQADKTKKAARGNRPKQTARSPGAAKPLPDPLKIPPILLEGDPPAAPTPAGGPGQRYELRPPPPPVSGLGLRLAAGPSPTVAGPELRLQTGPLPAPVSGPGERYESKPPAAPERFPAQAELPEAYGTQQLYLTARDPRWLYAHWDFSRDEMKSCNAQSADGRMMLRVYRDAPAGEPLLQIPLYPQSRDWFVPVPHAGAKYVAELGYNDGAGKWVGRATSGATLTPQDAPAEDKTVRFATIPAEVPFEQLVSVVREALRERVPLAEALLQLRADGHQRLPGLGQVLGPWTPELEQALARLISFDLVRQECIGSVEIAELIRRQLEKEISSQGAARAAELGGISSPTEKRERKRGFWFQVNAELVIYGSTEPDAKVTIGGRPVKLGNDGHFSLRFALPDGEYVLPVTAQSSDGQETRAELNFGRLSRYFGDVGTDPQDPSLPPPVADALV